MAEIHSSPTRAERIARQDEDHLDPDDDVLAGNFVYHDGDGCKYIRDGQRIDEISRAAAKRRWLAPCYHCVVEVTA